MMTLTHSDVHWCSLSLENVTIIDRYGELPNVPLLGIKGGITYNPCLVLRQFGYARRDGPYDMLILDLVFDFNNDNQGLLQRFIQAWRMPNKVDSKTLGHKNSIPLDTYLKRVLLYPKICPVIFLKTLQEKSPSCSSLLKSWTDKLSPKAVNPKLGFCVASRSVNPNELKGSPIY